MYFPVNFTKFLRTPSIAASENKLSWRLLFHLTTSKEKYLLKGK